jgi:PAS domain S-box-containing protein
MPDLRPFEEHSADYLRLIIESGEIGIWQLDLASGQAMRNRIHDEIFGYSEMVGDWSYERFLSHVADSDRERVDALQRAAIADGTDWAFECPINTAQGLTRWIRATGRALRNDDGDIAAFMGTVIDITSIKENENRLRLITEELNHRVRNMLAMIKSMVRFSATKAKTIAAFAEALEGRVSALARSHHLLVADTPTTMKASAILATELSAIPDLEERVQVSTRDEPVLKAPVAQGLALVFHELMTNAIKYGALSNETGHVEVTIVRDEREVAIAWRERGGPELAADAESGFGSMLISRAIASYGSTELDLTPAGAECRITLEVD